MEHVDAGAGLSIRKLPTVWKIFVTTATTMSSIVPVDLLAAATNPLYFSNLVTTNVSDPKTIALLSYNDAFADHLMGSNASARRLYNLDWEAFHEVCMLDIETSIVKTFVFHSEEAIHGSKRHFPFYDARQHFHIHRNLGEEKTHSRGTILHLISNPFITTP